MVGCQSALHSVAPLNMPLWTHSRVLSHNVDNITYAHIYCPSVDIKNTHNRKKQLFRQTKNSEIRFLCLV